MKLNILLPVYPMGTRGLPIVDTVSVSSSAVSLQPWPVRRQIVQRVSLQGGPKNCTFPFA